MVSLGTHGYINRMLIRLVTIRKTLAAINHTSLDLSDTHSDRAVESLRTKYSNFMALLNAEFSTELDTNVSR